MRLKTSKFVFNADNGFFFVKNFQSFLWILLLRTKFFNEMMSSCYFNLCVIHEI